MSSARQTATVDGQFVRAVIDGVTASCGYFEDRARRLLAESGLDSHPSTTDSYPLSAYVDVLETIEETTGPNTLNRIGQAVPRLLNWPAHVEGVGDALAAFDTLYRRHHADGDAGAYTFERTGETTGTLRSDTPYPAAFERGIVEGIAAMFGTDTGFISVRDGGSTRDARAYVCTWYLDRSEYRRVSIPAPETDAEPARAAGSSRSPVSGD